ncbi:MAG: glycosyltransferase family 4 protein [Bacteroidales bacterium]|nr:glycosyltransferase family 4 protein [Bacteroidales bacterium]
MEQISAKKIIIKSRLDLSWLKRVAGEIDCIRPDLLMTHGSNGHIAAMLTGILTRHPARKVCSYHGQYHAPSRGRKPLEKLFDFLTQYFVRNVAFSTVSVSEYSKNYLVSKGIDSQKIRVIHNGISQYPNVSSKRARERLRAEWKVDEQEILLGVVSRLDPIKGISYLIEAFTCLTERTERLKLAVIGTGNLFDSLKEEINRKGLTDRVIFTGFRSDVDDCLAALDVFILPSLAENHSIALLEAMRAQKPIIATDVGGNTESVRHEREAIVIPPADSHALCMAIERLVNDRQLMRRLSKAAHERFQQKFTTEQMVKKTADWMIECGNLSLSN